MISLLESNLFFKLEILFCNVQCFDFDIIPYLQLFYWFFPSMIQIFLVLLEAFFLSDMIVAFQIVEKLVFSADVRV